MAAVFTRPKSRTSGGEDLQIRVEDYLNDKLQTSSDLENIDTLLENVRTQQLLLKQQVAERHAHCSLFR